MNPSSSCAGSSVGLVRESLGCPGVGWGAGSHPLSSQVPHGPLGNVRAVRCQSHRLRLRGSPELPAGGLPQGKGWIWGWGSHLVGLGYFTTYQDPLIPFPVRI